MPSENVSSVVAFTAGVLTFLSPCIMPLALSFIMYITGISFADLKDQQRSEVLKTEAHRKLIAHTLLFIAGFSTIFILMGLTATVIGKALFAYQDEIRIAGGILIVLFGLNISGLLRFDFLEKSRRIGMRINKATYIGSFLVGVTFAVAWTPCAGMILGSILVIAGTEGNVAYGTKLLALYSAGLGLPFLLTALAINSFLWFLNKFSRFIGYMNRVAGILLIVVGILVATNSLSMLTERLLGVFGR
jgi:cytochrome c-type biogenesis protein